MEKDISLDDLIKQDKSKVKPKTKPIAKNQTKGKAFAQPRNLGGRANDNQGGNGKFGRGKQNNTNVNPNQNNPRRLKGAKLSNKLQPKNFIAQSNQNNQKNGNQKNEPRQAPPAPQKQTAPPQEKGKTLRVLGLQADVTNEELYVCISYNLETIQQRRGPRKVLYRTGQLRKKAAFSNR